MQCDLPVISVRFFGGQSINKSTFYSDNVAFPIVRPSEADRDRVSSPVLSFSVTAYPMKIPTSHPYSQRSGGLVYNSIQA